MPRTAHEHPYTVVYRRGDVWLANLDPQKGSEQGGVRPVVILQIDALNRVGNTVVVIPFTTNLKRAALPSAVFVQSGDGGLTSDSVALCQQMRVLDKSGLQRRLGTLSAVALQNIFQRVRLVLGL